MQIATAFSLNADTTQAAAEVSSKVISQLGQKPDLLIVYYTEIYQAHTLTKTLSDLFPDTAIHGCSSCQGVMTQQGFHSDDGCGLGVWAISDPAGDFGTAAIPLSENLKECGMEVIERAMEESGRPGELPDLIWFSSTPGHEETLLESIQEIVGESVPIAGGSAADNAVIGNWSLFSGESCYNSGVVVTLFYPSVKTSYAFHSGYSPTDIEGVVTKAKDRIILEIDGQPAAKVYNEWAGSLFSDEVLDVGGNILASTTLHPLGRRVGFSSGVEHFKLSHPDSITPTGGLTLFSDISEGDKLVLMTGSTESLVSRAGRVTSAAMKMGDYEHGDISGALVIYCAGCMLTVRDSMEDVSSSVSKALGDTSFLGAFTFGEQGCIESSGNAHGNLMISTVIFGK
ncbi:FIST signal transduction protein [Neptuniibacter sp. QD29_5]|uniref:FIST signal transduction protein n=1 Tax=Neptuniibacter sp. QD29_5 TaxID=3398207 RepID=UPI0039F63AEE